MAIIGEWARRLGYLLRRGAAEDDLRREMETHRTMMDDPRSFGNMLRLREESRQTWGWQWLEDLWVDTRFAWRTLRHSPGFALTAVLTLAIGIGVNTAMFTLVDGLLLAPLYQDAGSVVGVRQRSTTPGGPGRQISYPNFLDLREGTAGVFSDLAASATEFGGIDVGEGARRALASRVTANYFRIFGMPLALGRPFTAEEAAEEAEVAIIGFSLWQQQGGDAGILGRTIRVDGELHTVVGVAPEGFTGEGVPGPEVWTPLGDRRRDAHYLTVIGRVRDEMAIEAVEPVLATIGHRLEQAFPDVNRGYTFEVAPPPPRLPFLPAADSGAMTTISGLLMLMPVIVLLVASLNLADLLLARGHVRRQELAIRASLGGGRGRLMRQLLAEGLLLSIAGALLGLMLSKWATGMLLASIRPVLAGAVGLPAFHLDGRVLAATLIFSLFAVLVFGAWPAWKATGRGTALDIKQRGDDGQRGGFRLGRALITAQVALSLLLLASGGLFLIGVLSTTSADPGFRIDGGVVVAIDGGLAGMNDDESRLSQLAIVDRLRSLPGVESATIASGFPFSGFNESRGVVPAGTADPKASALDAVFFAVGRDHARVFGLPLLAGRDFTDREVQSADAEPVAIINDTLAARLWPGEDALDRQVQFVDDDDEVGPPFRVIGIVKGSNHSLGNPRPHDQVLVPLGQSDESAMMLQVRLADAAAERSMLATITREIRTVDPQMPILRSETWSEHIYESLTVWLYRAGAKVFAAFGLIALLLAVVGVYGVKSYLVARRTREFGIRLATGAQPRALLWQVLWEGGRVTAIGIGIGVVLSLAAGQFLRGLIYGINSVEPLVLITAPLILLAASLLASLIPALRATRVDPTVALRAE